MDTFTIVMAMLIAVMLSGILVRVFPIPIPVPFIQIGLGFLIAAIFQRGVLIEPEIFFLLFLPPLLFLDGWRVSKLAVVREASSIFQLAIGLVFLTVIGVGYLIHWMIPSIPLPVAFAIAAIVSPTDPVAVGAISNRVPIPRKMMAILEGESLLNDASGLVAFRFAVAAAVTGSFSLSQATLSFLWLSLAGITIGAGLTAILMYGNGIIRRKFGVAPGNDVLLSLIVPFLVYSVAEYMQVSGILAAVAAGICMSYVEMSGRLQATTRVERQAVWTMVRFTLNGMMFVLLGEQLPVLLKGLKLAADESGGRELYWLPIYGALICLGLVLTRLLWVVVSLKLGEFFARRRGKQRTKISKRIMLAISVAGVRGAVTLAGVMTLPLAMSDGSPFPARELAICLAAIVLLFSLVIASVGLPLLLKKEHHPANDQVLRERTIVQDAILNAALKSIATTCQELAAEHPDDITLYTNMADRLSISLLRQSGKDEQEKSSEALAREQEISRNMRLKAVVASRQAVYHLAKQHRISDTLAREQVLWLDMEEARILGGHLD
ncbi:Na+/H+ antiporter [Citrobacter farmeri]|uniref:Na+/H+ antiporter n=2 Tax=Enterobacteriaceae TaxID=543 RepID=A0A486W213_KLEPN|nr:Na+/H+ antiporter [Citrobacter farmeri]VGM56376.1 Na+/H+ antiporter [Klebsiella pneumoniae]HAT3724445.1 Na+/H+ antiporter [Citrobacter koseri]